MTRYRSLLDTTRANARTARRIRNALRMAVQGLGGKHKVTGDSDPEVEAIKARLRGRISATRRAIRDMRRLQRLAIVLRRCLQANPVQRRVL